MRMVVFLYVFFVIVILKIRHFSVFGFVIELFLICLIETIFIIVELFSDEEKEI